MAIVAVIMSHLPIALPFNPITLRCYIRMANPEIDVPRFRGIYRLKKALSVGDIIGGERARNSYAPT